MSGGCSASAFGCLIERRAMLAPQSRGHEHEVEVGESFNKNLFKVRSYKPRAEGVNADELVGSEGSCFSLCKLLC